MDQIMWIQLSGSNYVDEIVWIKSSGSDHLDQIILNHSELYQFHVNILEFIKIIHSKQEILKSSKYFKLTNPEVLQSMDPEKFLAIKNNVDYTEFFFGK